MFNNHEDIVKIVEYELSKMDDCIFNRDYDLCDAIRQEVIRVVQQRLEYMQSQIDELQTDALRYHKLRHWMSSNVEEGWNEVCNLAAIACYVDFDEFDIALDNMPVCNVGLCQVRD